MVLKKNEILIILAVLIILASGLMWFNVSPLWNFLFSSVSQLSAHINPADQNQTINNVNEFERLRALFHLTYIILGAGLTAFALIVWLVDYLLERWHKKIFFTVPQVLHRH